MNLTKAQKAALEIAATGDLIRWPGGFWALSNEPSSAVQEQFSVPERYVAAGTIYALDRKQLLMELGRGDAHPWSGPRRITEAGRLALSQALGANHEQ
jgi:hypothetical protein